MFLKKIFDKLSNTITNVSDAATNASKFKEARENSNISQSDAEAVLNNFKERHIKFTKLVQDQTSISSIIFSKEIEETIEDKSEISSWKEYFAIVKEAINDTIGEDKELENDESLSEISREAYYFEMYYNNQNSEMQELLDIHAGIDKIDCLTQRSNVANAEILNNAIAPFQKFSNSKVKGPK